MGKYATDVTITETFLPVMSVEIDFISMIQTLADIIFIVTIVIVITRMATANRKRKMG